jgi:hypothetical protein
MTPSKPWACRSRRCRKGTIMLQDGLIARLDEYTNRREALEAAGLSKQDAHADS